MRKAMRRVTMRSHKFEMGKGPKERRRFNNVITQDRYIQILQANSIRVISMQVLKRQ
jgi:hypothetical protein